MLKWFRNEKIKKRERMIKKSTVIYTKLKLIVQLNTNLKTQKKSKIENLILQRNEFCNLNFDRLNFLADMIRKFVV